MSYLSRIMQETGLSPAGNAPVAQPVPLADTGVVETNETMEPPHREDTTLPAQPPPTIVRVAGAEQPVHPDVPLAPRSSFDAASLAHVRPWIEVVPDHPARPDVPLAPQSSFTASLVHVPPSIEVVLDQPPTDPSVSPEPAQEAAVGKITIETPVEQTAAEPAPSIPREEDIALHTVRTIEDVRRWVAAGPQALDVAESSSGESPPEAVDIALEPLSVWNTPRSGIRQSTETHTGLPPEVHEVILNIGRIDLTVEAPAPPPAPAQTQAPPSESALPDTASQRLRRHYVNWPGGS